MRPWMDSPRPIRYILAAGCLAVFGACSAAPARAQVAYDTARVTVRRPPADFLATYRADPAFDYERARPEGASLWARFKRWVRETLLAPLGNAAMAPFWRGLMYLVVALGVAFAVLRLMGMEGRGLFFRSHTVPVGVVGTAEEPDTTDLDRLLDAALAARAYRQAVRLFYLKALRALVDRGLIRWRREKTNHDYLDELDDAVLKPAFAELTYLFDYLWYGDFPIDEVTFARMRAAHARFEQMLEEG